MPIATETQLAAGLRIAVMRLSRRLRAERPETDLTISQLAALASIERHGPLTLGALAAHERVQPPSMTRMVASLGERGLVTRGPHTTDGRQVVVAITPAGSDLLKEDRRRREAWLAQQIRKLSKEELDVLHAAAPILEALASSSAVT
ncbi:MAG: MarR family winged helix-turn-helix transcriptional regulator [Actinomycetes bacterium]